MKGSASGFRDTSQVYLEQRVILGVLEYNAQI